MPRGYWRRRPGVPDNPPVSPKKDSDKNGMATYGRFLGVAMMLPIASMVGYGMGYKIDQYFGTHWMGIILMLLGTVGGFIQLVREISR
jgi:F0F1-type ATP synthase assembly protein I